MIFPNIKLNIDHIGSLLGSIRHGGLIHDDDRDICMMMIVLNSKNNTHFNRHGYELSQSTDNDGINVLMIVIYVIKTDSLGCDIMIMTPDNRNLLQK